MSPADEHPKTIEIDGEILIPEIPDKLEDLPDLDTAPERVIASDTVPDDTPPDDTPPDDADVPDVLPPVLPDDDDLVDEDPPQKSPKTTKRKRGRRPKTPPVDDTAAVEARPRKTNMPESTPPTLPTAEPEVMPLEDAMRDDFDTWIQQYDWSAPGMQCKLKRLAPSYYNGITISGLLDTRQGAPFYEDEIRHQFGGGTYDVSIIGPRERKDRRAGGPRTIIAQINHRHLQVPGDPIIAEHTVPRDAQEAYHESLQGPRPRGRPHAQHQQQTPGGVEVLAETLRDVISSRDVTSGDEDSAKKLKLMQESFQTGAEQHVEAAKQISKEKDHIVEVQLQAAKEEVARAQRERDAAQSEARARLEEMNQLRANLTQEQRDLAAAHEARIKATAQEGNNLLTALLPMAHKQSETQITTLMTSYESRLASMESSFRDRIEALDRAHDNREKALQLMHQTQLESTKTLYQGRVEHLERENSSLRDDVKRTTSALDKARSDLLLEVQKINKSNDPLEQVSRMGGLVDTLDSIKTVLGGGSKDDDIGEGIDSPLVRSGARMLNKVLDNIPHITEAIAARGAQQQAPAPPPPQQAPQVGQVFQTPQGPAVMTPQGPQLIPPEMQQVAMIHQPQQPGYVHPLAGRAGPQAPRAPRRRVRKLRVKREDIEPAFTLISGAFTAGQDPETVARAISVQADQAMIREFVRRDAEMVIDELERHGVIQGPLLSPEGRNFLLELFGLLRRGFQGGLAHQHTVRSAQVRTVDPSTPLPQRPDQVDQVTEALEPDTEIGAEEEEDS